MTHRVLSALALIALGGCFDSLVSDPCATGYSLVAGHCVAGDRAPDAGIDDHDATDEVVEDITTDEGVDGGLLDSGLDGAVDGGLLDADPVPDALVCEMPELACAGGCIDASTDPNHCGTCGHVCASGICSAGHCAGGLPGHIVTIGHDYRGHHDAMARVLGNAVALGRDHDVGVARWRGTAHQAASDGTSLALAQAMVQIGRPWHAVALPATPSPTALDDIDVLVIEAQTGDGDAAQSAATAWAAAIDELLHAGGVVIVLEGAGGVSHRFAQGANLFAIAPPVDATDVPAFVVDAADALAQQVVSPYLAETSSVVFPDLPSPVIATATGEGIVFHTTRP